MTTVPAHAAAAPDFAPVAMLPASSRGPSAAELADPARARAWKAAQDFEAMTLGELLEPMFDTVDSSAGAFGGGEGEQAWKPMMVQEMGRRIAARGGLGLAEPVYRQLLAVQERR